MRYQRRPYLGVRDYPEVARHSIPTMHGQIADLVLDPVTGWRGLPMRHPVMPDALEPSRQIFRWLAETISPDTCR